MTSDDLCGRLERVRSEIERCSQTAGRAVGSVTLLAVSKTHPVEAIRALHACGQRAFGESYAQELAAKSQALADLSIEWHFIGPIQANKTRIVSAHAAWAHGVDRLHIAERLAAQRPAHLPPLQVCIQVNVDAELTKSGVGWDELHGLATAVARLDPARLRLRGLMCIPRERVDPRAQREPFARLRQAFAQLNAAGFALDTLSMGMSHDFAAAIAECATIVRVGTAIFGPRH